MLLIAWHTLTLVKFYPTSIPIWWSTSVVNPNKFWALSQAWFSLLEMGVSLVQQCHGTCDTFWGHKPWSWACCLSTWGSTPFWISTIADRIWYPYWISFSQLCWFGVCFGTCPPGSSGFWFGVCVSEFVFQYFPRIWPQLLHIVLCSSQCGKSTKNQESGCLTLAQAWPHDWSHAEGLYWRPQTQLQTQFKP